MKRALFAVLLSLLATVGFAQETANFTYAYDVDSATLTYCVMNGQGGPWGASLPGRGLIETDGSSTTVTGVNAADDVFRDVAVGDVIEVRDADANTVTLRVVATKTDNDEITVNTAVNWSAQVVWRWWNVTCGTGADNGWIDIDRGTATTASSWMITSQYDAGDLTGGLAMRIECKAGAVGSQPVIVYPSENDTCGTGGDLNGNQCEFATAGIDSRLAVVNESNHYALCRVGLAAVTSDSDGTVESVTVSLVAR